MEFFFEVLDLVMEIISFGWWSTRVDQKNKRG